MSVPEVGTHIQLAVSEDERGEQLAMRQAHDACLEKLPERFIRFTGVQWTTYDRDPGILVVEKLTKLSVDEVPHTDVIERLREWPKAILVVATVDGVEPFPGPCRETCPPAIQVAYRAIGFEVHVGKDYPRGSDFPPVRYVCPDRGEWWISLIRKIEEGGSDG